MNTVQWVVSGKASAGVIDSTAYAEIPEETRSELVVLAETESVPRQVMMVRSGMDAAQLEAVKALLIQLDQTEEGQAVLEKFVTSKFDEFPEGADAGMARMEEMYQLVQAR